MLTEGDRVEVTRGDWTGETGTIEGFHNDLCGVDLDAGGHIGLIAEHLRPIVDNVNHPQHYTSHPSGVEVIQITEHMGFCLGNAVKYILRSDLKGNAIEDLRKAAWYINREIEKREAS